MTQQLQTYVLTIQKLPGGGYAMAYATDGQSPDIAQAYAACSTLHEVFQRLVHPIVQQHFGEPPVYYSHIPQPPAVPEQFDLPIVATGPQPPENNNGGLMGRLGGYASSVGAVLWLGALWAGIKLSGMV